MQTLEFIFSFIFGCLFGSFLNVVVLRLPQEQSLEGRSHCPNCGHILSSWDLIPLLSWVVLRGRCRYCHHKISFRYFFIELVSGLLFAFSFWFIKPISGLDFLWLLKDWLVIFVLMAVFIIDLEHFLILDSIIFIGLALVSILNLALDIFSKQFIFSVHSHFFGGLISAVLAALPFFMIWYVSGGRWMGFGDVKLALFLGAALGGAVVFVGIMLGILLGGFISVLLLMFTSKNMKSQLPFGTFLAVGSLIALFYGPFLWHAYLSIVGI